jgi:hypothetical protein
MRARILGEMEAKLASGLKMPGDDFRQRQVLQAIILEAYKAKEPVLEWLAKQLGPKEAAPDPAPVAAVAKGQNELFKCGVCQREFSSHHALCGHQRTHSKQATGLVDGLV